MLETLSMNDVPANVLAQPILDWFREHGVIHTFEPSFKLGQGYLSEGRGLFGFNKARLGGDPDRKLLQFCARLGMPAELIEMYRCELLKSNYVGFGYECDGEVQRYKAYLDFSRQLEVAAESARTEDDSERLFLGFKWTLVGDGRPVVTHYRRYPLLTRGEMRRRSLALLGALLPARAVIEAAFDLCDRDWPDRPLEYMEAREPGNARISFDIKFYSTSFVLSSLIPALQHLGEKLGIGASLPRFLAANAASNLGHLAGGMDRSGLPFFMVYHGVKRGIDPAGQSHSRPDASHHSSAFAAAPPNSLAARKDVHTMSAHSKGPTPSFRYDPQRHGWYLTSGEATLSTALHVLSTQLDGELTTSPAAINQGADDYGHIVHQQPLAILRPGSVDDVIKMVKFASQHGLHIASRGNAFNTFGQSQAQAGVVIDMSSLNRIHAISSEYAVVDAGITWRNLLLATLEHGRTPVVLTDFVGTTVGGTLSVGGFGGTTHLFGGQLDHAQELQVVTGNGELITCSETENVELFQTVLGGLGLCGIIVRATVRLHPAATRARTHRLLYPDLQAMLKDLRYLVHAERFSHLRGHAEVLRGAFAYFIEATSFYTSPETLPEAPYHGLCQTNAAENVKDRTFFEYADLVVEAVAALEEAGLGAYPHPWLDLIVPDSRIEGMARQIIATIDPARVLPGAPILFYPMQRAKLTRPLPAMPDESFCWGFDVLRTVLPHPGVVMTALEQNQRFFEQNRAQGGRLYPISAVKLGRLDWKKNFAPHWDALKAQRALHDPKHLFGHSIGL
jgi:FAD/FMN-containing dehydrogenase